MSDNFPADHQFDFTALRENLRRAAANMTESLDRLRNSPGMKEARSKARYREAVVRERALGREYVRALGIQARFELGLPLHDRK